MAYSKFKRARGRRTFRRRTQRGFRRRVRRIAFGIAEKKYLDYWFGFNLNNGAAAQYEEMPLPNNVTSEPMCRLPQEFTPVSLVQMIQQGFTRGTRVGNRIALDYIQLVISIAFDGSTFAADENMNGCVCRYQLIKPKGTPGTVAVSPYVSNVFRNSVQAMKDPDQMRTRKTSLDRQVRMAVTSTSVGGTALSGTGVPVIQHFIKMRGRQVQFNAVAALNQNMRQCANITDGDVWFQACAENPGMCYMAVGVRVCYRDA